MAVFPHKTEYVVTFWVPLPFPLGVPDGTELSLLHKGAFPEDEPGFFVPDHPDGPQYIEQTWKVFQRKDVPTSPGVEFAESLMRTTLEEDFGLDGYQLETSAEMQKLGIHQQTVVEAACAIEQPEHDLIVAKLNEVATAIAEFHVRLNSLHGLPATRFGPRAIDPSPFLVTAVEGSDRVLYGLTSTGEVTKYANALNVPEATEDQIAYAAQLGREEPFRPALVLEMEARNAYAVGSNILAAICFGAAAEARLTELCQFVCWEADVDAAVVARAISGRGGVGDSCLQLLGKYLKGNWHRYSSPALKAWQENIVTLRNQAAHNGYEPTAADIDRAQTSFYELLAFLRERVLGQMTRFPYVTSYYIGQPKLLELGLKERWERHIADYPLTPDPDRSFHRYKAEVRFRGEKKFDSSQVRGPHILQITDGNGEKAWVQLDDQVMVARKITAPDTPDWNELQRIRLRNSSGYYTEVLTSLPATEARPLGEWVPASYLVPSFSVKRSDQYQVLDYNLSHPDAD